MVLAVGHMRKDVAEWFKRPTLLKTGFMENFDWKDTQELPAIEAFAVDERRKRLYPLAPIP